MNVRRPQNDIVEIFGYAPNDTTRECRTLWTLGACPFVSCPVQKPTMIKRWYMAHVVLLQNLEIVLFAQIDYMQTTLKH